MKPSGSASSPCSHHAGRQSLTGRRSVLLALTVLLTAIGSLLVVSGGFVTTTWGVRFSARSPVPAFVSAAAALALWLVSARRAGAVHSDLRSAHCWLDTHAAAIVTAVALLAATTAVAFNGFSATGADASGYLSQAAMLASGALSHAEPLAPIARWQEAAATLAPLGWRAAGGGEQVPTYAVGLPLLLALPHALGGARTAALVIPLFLVVAIASTAAVAHRLGGALAAMLAAIWLATSPVALIESMQVMSDVPVTAMWMLCWFLVMRSLALPAGLAAALAILIRPNLAPLALVPVAYLFWSRRQSARPPAMVALVAFALPVVCAAAVVALLQWRWFGSPFRSGYGTASEIYTFDNVVPNARLYAAWLLTTHGPWLFAAPLALALARARGALLWLIAFAAGVVCAYLVYAQFEVWTYLRFLLPAIAIAMVGVSALLAALVARVPRPARAPLGVCLLIAVACINLAAARDHDVFRFGERNVRARTVGTALASTVPVNSVIVTGEQSGAMRYYTGRTILRWDLMDDAAMNAALDWLTLNGYQLWVVLDDWEEDAFRRRMPALAALSLDYEPTLESAAGVGIRTRAWRVRRFSARSSNSE